MFSFYDYKNGVRYTSLDHSNPEAIPEYTEQAPADPVSADDLALACINETFDRLHMRQAAWERVCRARDRYDAAVLRATGCTGIRYDKDRVQTSPCPGDAALIDMIDAHDAYDDAYQQYVYKCQILTVLIDRCPCTLKQKRVLTLRYNCDVAPCWAEIAAAMGMTVNAAEVLETRAFTSVCKYFMRGEEVA